MSYNPARQQGKITPRRQRRMDPRGGIRHSDIVAKHGPTLATMDDVRNRQETSRGFRVILFRGDDFEMVYEYICSKNATGLIKHPESDRSFRVAAGVVYVMIGEETIQLNAGTSFAILKGTEYQLATSGSADAELFMCQGSNYEEGIEQLTPAEFNDQTKMLFAEPQGQPRDRSSATSEVTRQNAEKMQEERRQREVARKQGLSRVVDEQSTATADGTAPRRTPPRTKPILPGQQVPGVNPRPMGPNGFGDE